MTHLNKIMLNFTLLFKTQKGNNENRNIVVRKKYRNIIVRKLDLLKCAFAKRYSQNGRNEVYRIEGTGSYTRYLLSIALEVHEKLFNSQLETAKISELGLVKICDTIVSSFLSLLHKTPTS